MVMPGSEWMLLKKDGKPHDSIAESLLASISEIIELLVCIGKERETFLDFGSYLYRASAVIMELEMNNNVPKNTIETIQSMAKSINLAKDHTMRCQNRAHRMPDSELTNIMEDLEGVMKNVGNGLNLILSSTQGEQDYAEIAAKSLSKEMKGAHLVVGRTRLSEQRELEGQLQTSLDLSAETETDLYSVDFEVSMENLQALDTSNLTLINSIGSTTSINPRSHNSSSGTYSMSLPRMAEYMEPLYETFFCPLTNSIMDDPVTIESGVTFDRKAITEWLNKFKMSEEIFCPKSGQKLKNKNLKTNEALKATIDEWKERNEVARIKVARAALSLASTENMILEAIDDLHVICQKKQYNKVQIRNIGIIPLLAKFLDHKSSTVRCATLELLQQLAEDDDDGKEIIAKTMDASKIIKMLSSNHQPVRHASALLLLELSKSKFFCDKIEEVAGGILMLITIKYRQPIDAFTSLKAEEILKNLETSPANIKCMAENGYWEPLLDHLNEGSEETKMEMACYLGEIVVGPDSKSYVTEKASSALIHMVHSGNSLSRSAAFKALKQISPNATVLVEAGIVQVMVEEMFARTIQSEPMNSMNEAAAVLANIFDSGIVLENLQVNVHGHTMTSDYIVCNIINRVKNSTPEDLNINLIRILSCLMKFPEASATIVSVLKETEASYNLIELINNPNEELVVASIKLLITLSPFMGHTLSDRLCKTKGLPESLIQNPDQIARITEKHAVSANFLAKLPHQNLTLNLALLNQSIVAKVIQSISWVQRTGPRTSRYASVFLEGLVGTLVRFTTTLYDYTVLSLVRDYNFTLLFTELVMKTSSDEVQKLSAIGLENLSKQSVNLSKPREIKKTISKKAFIFTKYLSFKSSKDVKALAVCPVHRGFCSSKDTFCLLDAKAVERLLTCLDHDNAEVVKAALSAICTLLDDNVDVGKSVKILHEMQAIGHILNAMKEHREETLLQKSFWVIDKFLMKGGDESVSDISEDRLFPATLVTAFHHGDECTRQMAEKILRHLNKMPTFSATFTL